MKEMKKIMIVLAMVLSLTLFTSCEKDGPIDVGQLPEAARVYLQKNYPEKTIVFAKKDVELFTTKYEVALDDGMKIEFGSDGLPVDVDMYD